MSADPCSLIVLLDSFFISGPKGYLPNGRNFCDFFVYLSHHTTHTTTAERKAENSASAEAPAVI